MSRNFSLAGLLRLRHLEQDVAASDLASANARVRDNASRRARARNALGSTASEASTIVALHAVAAARASSRSMFAEFEAVEQRAGASADEARQRFETARVRSIGLEKLADRHDAEVASEDLRLDQAAIDELAVSAWHRVRGDR
ncbi:MAG TPA: flagellar FliJ family protein [Marisediminicola sp.]|jgi:flagellar FliJ protein|nr:flagellar FliJ family protein [Marisediminicola sp.]